MAVEQRRRHDDCQYGASCFANRKMSWESCRVCEVQAELVRGPWVCALCFPQFYWSAAQWPCQGSLCQKARRDEHARRVSLKLRIPAEWQPPAAGGWAQPAAPPAPPLPLPVVATAADAVLAALVAEVSELRRDMTAFMTELRATRTAELTALPPAGPAADVTPGESAVTTELRAMRTDLAAAAAAEPVAEVL